MRGPAPAVISVTSKLYRDLMLTTPDLRPQT